MVSNSTRGVSSHRDRSSRSRREIVDLPTATDPATPITNGVLSLGRRRKLLVD